MRYRTFGILLPRGRRCSALPSTALARIKLITLPVRERVEIQLDNPNATLVEEERIVPLVKGRQPGRFLLGQHPDRPEHDRLPRAGGIDGEAAKPAERSQGRRQRSRAAGRESPLGQLSAQRGGAGLAGLFQRLRLGPRADQLSPGQPHQEFQLSGGRRQRREDARPLRVHPHPEPGQRVVRLDRALGRFRAAVPQADRHERDQGDAGREVQPRCRSRRPTPATRRPTATSTGRRTSCWCRCTTC